MKALTKRLITLGVSSVIAVSGAYMVAPWEGDSNKAYLDMVGIPTICNGYTIGVKLGDYKTDEECEELLAKELTHFNTQMNKAVKVPMTEQQEIAFTSLVWNIGVGAFHSSTLLKRLNEQQYDEACKQILRWNKAGGRVVQGLVNRREAEYKVCIGKDANVNKALAELKASKEGSLDIISVQSSAPETVKLTEDEQLPSPVILNENNPILPIEQPTKTPSCVERFLGVFWCTKYS